MKTVLALLASLPPLAAAASFDNPQAATFLLLLGQAASSGMAQPAGRPAGAPPAEAPGLYDVSGDPAALNEAIASLERRGFVVSRVGCPTRGRLRVRVSRLEHGDKLEVVPAAEVSGRVRDLLRDGRRVEIACHRVSVKGTSVEVLSDLAVIQHRPLAVFAGRVLSN